MAPVTLITMVDDGKRRARAFELSGMSTTSVRRTSLESTVLKAPPWEASFSPTQSLQD
jgi:hypothetical protein